MKFKKVLLPTLLIPFLLVGCTKPTQESSSEGGKSEPESSEPSSSEPAPTGKVTVEFWHTFGDMIETELDHQIANFERLVKENEGVDVEIVPFYAGGYGDMVEKVTLGVAGGTGSPTIAVAYPDHVADYFDYEKKNMTGGQTLVVNMDDLMNDPALAFGVDTYYGDNKGVGDFIPAFIEEGRQFYKDGLYVLPFMKSSEVMIYNLDAAKRAMKFYDNTVPEDKVAEKISNFTWDELMEFGKVAYEHKDDVASNLEYSIYYDSDSNLFISKLFQNDIDYSSIDANGKGVIGFESGANRANAEKMVQDLLDAHNANIITTKGTTGTYASDNFKKQKCIFTIGSSGGAGYTFPEAGNFDVEVTAVPASNDNPLYVSQGPSLTLLNRTDLTKAENDLAVKYGWKFMKFLTSTDVNISMCINGSQGYVPVRSSSYATETFLEFIEEGELYAATASVLLNDIDGNYLSTAVFTGSATMRTQVGSIIASSFGGTTDVANAFELAINAITLDL